MSEDDLGRYKQTLKDICPSCGQGNHLEVRGFGQTFYGNRYFSNEIVMCPRCGFKLDLKPQKKRSPRNIDTPWPDDM
jgi:rRNA maturation protein Nop10